jgi:hypothetical protein
MVEGPVFPAYMSTAHRVVAVVSIFLALGALGCILFGWAVSMRDYLGIDKSLRDVAVAVWAFALPAFFVVEETWFLPKVPPHTQQDVAQFYEDQKKARFTWLAIGGIVSVLIGLTAPTFPPAGSSPSTPPAATPPPGG